MYKDCDKDPDATKVGYQTLVLVLLTFIALADVATSEATVISNEVLSPFLNVIVDSKTDAVIIPNKGNDAVTA